MTSEEKTRAAVAGYVLAGGASRRFGSDKALAEFAGRTLLSRMCDVVAAAAGNARIVAPPDRYQDQEFEIVEDHWPLEGPLGGIITALHATRQDRLGSDWSLILGCDMPFISREWLEYLIERTPATVVHVIVPRSTFGLEPLCACWNSRAAAPLVAAFDMGVRKVTQAMQRLRVEVLDETHWKRFDSAGRLFWNMNTQQDYQAALQMWETSERERNQ